MTAKLPPISPGEVLLEEFLTPADLGSKALALEIGVDPHLVEQIVQGQGTISTEMALRLARYFHTSANFWLGLQADYDLDLAADL